MEFNSINVAVHSHTSSLIINPTSTVEESGKTRTA
jgi:hypothetical protein